MKKIAEFAQGISDVATKFVKDSRHGVAGRAGAGACLFLPRVHRGVDEASDQPTSGNVGKCKNDAVPGSESLGISPRWVSRIPQRM